MYVNRFQPFFFSFGLRITMQTDHVKRTFDYEPFVKEYTRSLQREGILDALLGQDSDGNKSKGSKPSQKL